jgi:dTDP-glucose 4,6-dehydratase
MNKQLEKDLKELIEQHNYFSGLENSSFFITGSTGLIGSLLIKTLLTYSRKNNSNIKIYALCRSSNKFNSVFTDFLGTDLIPIFTDLLNLDLQKINFSIDYIIHGAAITTSKDMVEHAVETLDTAYIGTRNILNLAKSKKIKSMVYLSSMEVYGVTDTSLNCVTEKNLGYIDILSPRSSYSEGKRICECLCACYANEYAVPVKCARLAQTLGAGIDYNDTRVPAMFARSVVENKNIVLKTAGSTKRPIVYTTDAISGILTILKHGEFGKSYNIANETTFCSIKETAQLIVQEIAKSKIKLLFDIQEKNNFAPDVLLNLSSKKANNLGWSAKISLKEAYSRMIESFLNS